MAQIKHNDIVDTVHEVFTIAKNKGSLHLYAEDEVIDSGKLTFHGKKVLHFATCGYMGLEHHPKLKEGAIRAIENYGVQFPMSKTYVSNPLYTQLESLVSKMYDGAPIVISKNCTMSHLATIPTIVKPATDLIILDHQVHASVQQGAQKLLAKGGKIEMIRHNSMEMLEDMILKYRNKYEKIWYMADGVYSMFGDFAPIKQLIALAEKYEQLWLYVDDAHGMSWAGKYGAGYVMSQMDNKLYSKMVLTATLGKAFGSCGGVTVFPNADWQDRVKTFGGPNTFSVQLEPPILGAAVASAKLHLSDEISGMQVELQKRIEYFNALIERTDLPLVNVNNSPIFYIANGAMGMSNNLITRLIEDGVYINVALFPAVPAKNTGARITLSLNNSFEEIEELADKLNHHFFKSMEEEGQTLEAIRKSFRMEPRAKKESETLSSQGDEVTLKVSTSIEELDKAIWNQKLGHRGMFDYAGMKFLEKSFSGNELPEENYDFKYYTAFDRSGNVVLSTFFMEGLCKDDLFHKEAVSRHIEEERKYNPYYLTSKVIIMGSLFTEGDHLYIDKTNPHWQTALAKLIGELYVEQERIGAANIILRDFREADEELHAVFMDKGFVKVDMPESCVIEKLGWKNEEEYLELLTPRSKRHYKQEIKRFHDCFDVEIRETLSTEELEYATGLFQNVKDRNLAINTFNFPPVLFQQINEDPSWEFIVLKLKPEVSEHQRPVAVCFCHKNADQVYSFMLVGMDYQFTYEYGVYRQALYQVAQRANALGALRANLGISASIEKKKVGAALIPKVAYFHAKDNYVMESIEATILNTNA